MYRINLYLFLIFFACGQPTSIDTKPAVLTIAAGEIFQNDSIQVKIDNDVMYSGRVSTNYSISAAWTSGLRDYSAGHHLIEFKIYNYNINDTFRFNLEDTLTVLVRFNRQQRHISFDTYDGIIMRD